MNNDPFRKNDCCICGEISSRRLPEEFQRVYGIPDRICAETEHFIAFPTVSPLTTGHMLIFPKRHVPSLRVLPPDQIRLLNQLAADVWSQVSSESSTGYFFEHGVLEDGIGSCGITHAHLHIIPLQSGVADEVTRHASSSFSPQLMGSLESVLSGSPQPQSPYLLFGENLANIRLACASSIPSQFMRRIIATVVGIPDWNWRNLTGVEDFHQTISKFGNKPLCSA